MEFISILWNEGIMRPMVNSLALLSDVLFDNFGLSIIVFTVLIRLAMIPLSVRQTKQMRKMQEIQPKLKALQEKYKDKGPAEKRQLSQETMRLYREAGVNPVGCLGPMIIQMPIWFGMYRAILRTMPPTPEGMANLSSSFYSWNPAVANVPINSHFLGIDLVDFVQFAPVPWNFLFPVLVGATMWLQQKMTTGNQVAVSPQQAQTNQIMLWMLPIMFAFMTYTTFPGGLAVYILFSNLIGIVIQYYVGGRQPIILFGRAYLGSEESKAKALAARGAAAEASALISESQSEENDEDEQSPDVYRENRRRGDRRRAGGSRRRARRRRN